MHFIYIWLNYNDLTATSLGIMVSKGNHPQMALIQVSQILEFAQIYVDNWLLVWNMIFFEILGMIIPTDELIFSRGVGIPPTR